MSDDCMHPLGEDSLPIDPKEYLKLGEGFRDFGDFQTNWIQCPECGDALYLRFPDYLKGDYEFETYTETVFIMLATAIFDGYADSFDSGFKVDGDLQ